MSVILLFSAIVTRDEAHLICSLNDAYLKGLQICLVVHTHAFATLFVSFHVQRLA
jgi:hypothetical protein